VDFGMLKELVLLLHHHLPDPVDRHHHLLPVYSREFHYFLLHQEILAVLDLDSLFLLLLVLQQFHHHQNHQDLQQFLDFQIGILHHNHLQ
jgi:hypothetical protein